MIDTPQNLLISSWNTHQCFQAIQRAWRQRSRIVLINPVLRDKFETNLTWKQAFVTGSVPPSFFPESQQDSCIVLLTSGTTGNPEWVLLPYSSIEHNISTLYEHLELDHEFTIFMTVPIFHAYGLVLNFLLSEATGIHLGFQNRFQPQSFIADLKRNLEQSQKKKILLPLVPTQIDLLATYYPEHSFTEFEGVAIVGGDRMTEDQIATFRNMFPNLRLTIGYGLTEAGPALFHTDIHSFPCSDDIGFPLPGTKIKSDHKGTIWFQSPGQCTFKKDFSGSKWNSTHGKWLSTGDILVETNKCWKFYARTKRVIKIKGETIPPQLIEETYRSHLDTDFECLALQENDKIALFYSGETDGSKLQTLTKNLPTLFRPVIFYRLDSLPRNSLGKIDFTKLANHAAKT